MTWICRWSATKRVRALLPEPTPPMSPITGTELRTDTKGQSKNRVKVIGRINNPLHLKACVRAIQSHASTDGKSRYVSLCIVRNSNWTVNEKWAIFPRRWQNRHLRRGRCVPVLRLPGRQIGPRRHLIANASSKLFACADRRSITDFLVQAHGGERVCGVDGRLRSRLNLWRHVSNR